MNNINHSLLYIRPDSKSTMDALIADLLKMISIKYESIRHPLSYKSHPCMSRYYY